MKPQPYMIFLQGPIYLPSESSSKVG